MHPGASIVAGWALCASLAGGVAATAEPSVGPLDAARSLHLAGEWREALAAYGKVAASGEPADAAVALNNACTIHNRLAEYQAALDTCDAALRLRRGLGDERRLGRTLNNLGLALQRLGRYGEAERTYREALDINQRLGDLQAQLINRQNLGLTATEAGRYGQALELFQGAEELAAEHGGESWAAYQGRLARLNRGVVLEKLGAYREALELYLRLAEERDALDDDHWASLQVNLGVMYRNLGDPVRAVAAFEEAAAAYERLGDAAALSNATLNLALAWHLNLGRPDDAEVAYRKALELARTSGDRAEEIQDLFYLGRLLLDLGRLDEAEAVFEECLEASETAGSAEGRWSAVYGLGRILTERGQKLEALERFERAIGEIEAVRAGLGAGELRAGYFGDKRPVYASAVEILAGLEAEEPDTGHGTRGLEVVQRTKARELLDSLGAAAAATLDVEELDAEPLDAEALDAEALDAEALDAVALDAVALDAEPLDAGELASLAGRGVLIEYFIGSETLYRWLIRGGEIRMDDLGPARPILDRVLEIHRALSAGQAPPPGALETLAGDLLPGVESAIDGASRAWVAPDGILHYLPFEVLPLAGEPLVEAIDVAYLPSASALGNLESRREPAEVVLAGLGDPLLGTADTDSMSGRVASRFGLQPLPAAARELAAIGELMGDGSALATGARATEETFRRAAARGARILHLATHTVLDERPGRGAAILLTPADGDDGLLRPAEIAALDLRVDLAVLAACRSALGGVEDGRAFASLTGSFLAAGSRAVLASLWDVGDEASAAFMSQLYYQLGRGHPPASALRRAKLRLRADPAWDRPDLWAAFILIGDAPGVVPRRLVPTWAWFAVALVVAVLLVRRSRTTRTSGG